MPKLNIPMGSEITKNTEKQIRIKFPNTNFWVIAEKIGKLWDVYLLDPQTDFKELIQEKITTAYLSSFSNQVLNTQIPDEGKRDVDITIIKRFIEEIIKKTNGKHKSSNINC